MDDVCFACGDSYGHGGKTMGLFVVCGSCYRNAQLPDRSLSAAAMSSVLAGYGIPRRSWSW